MYVDEVAQDEIFPNNFQFKQHIVLGAYNVTYFPLYKILNVISFSQVIDWRDR